MEWFVLNTEAIVEVDLTAIDALEEFQAELAANHITFALARVKQNLYAQLKRSGLLQKIGPDHIFLTLHIAIAPFKHINKTSVDKGWGSRASCIPIPHSFTLSP